MLRNDEFINGRSKTFSFLFPVVLFGLMLFLSLNRHSHSGYYNYHSEIWADKAGYYIYLPAALKYHFDVTQFPDSIEQKTGFGFKLDKENKRILTKYTYGIALMQLPFYLGADLLAKPLGFKNDAFSPIYYKCIDLAAVSYLVIGLYFLYRFLKRRANSWSAGLSALFLILSTNLYYYAIDETGMSHVYSFFLFSLFLYLCTSSNFLLLPNKKVLFGLALTGSLIVIIRPINVLFLMSYFLLDLHNPKEFVNRLKSILNPKSLLILLPVSFMVALPQLIYWFHTTGSVVSYSYGKETFYWDNPQLLKTWFSPYNGLFLYCPFYFLIIALTLLMIYKKIQNGLFLLALFLLLSYVLSCWWDTGFGCSFGARSYVEYLALYSIPLVWMLKRYSSLNRTGKFTVIILILFCIAYNLKMTYSYDGCFYGNKDWDWHAYLQHLFLPTK